MSRNHKREYLKKLIAIETSNGYKVDLPNYIYNPNLMYEYPTIRKVIEEDSDNLIISTIYYQKYYNGTGEYFHRIHSEPKTSESIWTMAKEQKDEAIEKSNRFNLNKLIQLAETR